MYVILCVHHTIHTSMERYKFNIKFRLEQRRENPKDKNSKLITKNLPINADITFGGKRLFFFTGFRIDANQWIDKVDEGESIQRVKKNNFNAKGNSASEINNKLSRIQTALKDIFQRFETYNTIPGKANVRDELKKELGEMKVDEPKSVFDCFQLFIDHVSVIETWAKGTKTKYQTILNLLKEFRGKKNLYFEDINQRFFEDLVYYMINKKKNVSTNENIASEDSYRYSNAYISKCVKDLKRFLNWATKNGYNKNVEYKEYSPKLKGVSNSSKANILALSIDEFLTLYNLDIKQKYLQQVRDVFCFCCASSLRYSDVKNLKWSNIKDGYIEFTSIKTVDQLIIPLNEYSQGIIDKYKEFEGITVNVLPVISNQKYNQYLKELGKLANFDSKESKVSFRGSDRIEKTKVKYELLTSHVARKTFVTLGVYLGMPSEVIRSFTGHKDPKVMERYWKANNAMKNKYMDLFNFENKDQNIESVFDFNITDEERSKLCIPPQEEYIEIIKSDHNTSMLHLAFLFQQRGNYAKALEYMGKLPDAMKVQFMQTISTK